MLKTRPNINVTPLIDVLLVLLIIFMVVTPLCPAVFKAKLPSDERTPPSEPNPKSLLIEIAADNSMTLNTAPLELAHVTGKLAMIFELRKQNMAVGDHPLGDRAFTLPDNIERTVFIKAARSMDYGTVARVIDERNRPVQFPSACSWTTSGTNFSDRTFM
jgi:biopolymer transport protein ExbD